MPLEPAGGRAGRSVHNAKIALVDFAILDLLVQNAQCLRVLCGNDNAAGIAVDAVAQGRCKGVLLSGPPLAVGVEICLNVIDQRFAVFRAVMRMHGLPGLFIDQQEIFVLIDDMQFRRGDGQISIFFFWGIKKLVVDV